MQLKNYSLNQNSLKGPYLNIEKRINSSIIEIHNRPSYVNILISKIKNRVITLYFHNDPLSMDGSKTIEDRKKLLNIPIVNFQYM